VSRYNHHFANHFSSCVLLACARDPHRDRDVQLRLLPGEFDVVGVTDGVDSWVAPVAGDPFSVNIQRILADIREGKPHVPPLPRQRERKRLLTTAAAPAPSRERRRLTGLA
jgi:hypothetical protein